MPAVYKVRIRTRGGHRAWVAIDGVEYETTQQSVKLDIVGTIIRLSFELVAAEVEIQKEDSVALAAAMTRKRAADAALAELKLISERMGL